MDKTILDPNPRIELLGLIIDTAVWVYGLLERWLRTLEATAHGVLSTLEADRPEKRQATPLQPVATRA